MSLTLPLEELYRLRVSAKISSKDGRIALTLKPEPSNPGLTQDHPSGLSVHFETAQEDGGSALSIFTSYEAPLALAAPQKNGQKDTGADSSCLPSGDFQDNHISSDSNIPLENYPSSHETRDLETAANFNAWLPGWSGSFMSELNNPVSVHATENGEIDLNNTEGFSISNDTESPLRESPDFNGAGISTEFGFVSQQTSDRLGQEESFFLPSLPTSTPDDPSASSPTEDSVPDTDESSAHSSPSPGTPSSSNVQTARWRRVACLHPGCDRRFISLHTQRTHMRTHETKTRQYFHCTMGCPEVFSRQHDRMRHEVTKHGRECKWSCDQCRKFFSFERTLKNHKCSGDGFSRWSLPTTEREESVQPN